MRVSAEFDDSDVALAAAKTLTDEGDIAADDIEIRSAWPLFEEALPPHFHRPMRIRNFVRFLWVCGAICGFSMVWYCQSDYPIRTSGHPIVPLPIDAIITYECAQITGLIMTTFFFFIETNPMRMRPIPEEEDLAVANGQLAVVVGGPRAEVAKGLLERGGARIVRTFNTLLIGIIALTALFTSGCADAVHQVAQFPQVRMRTQTGQGVPGYPLDWQGEDPRARQPWPIKDSENANAPYDPNIFSMPTSKDPDIAAMPEPFGKLLEPTELALQQREHPGKSTPTEVKNFANPTENTTGSEERGQKLYAENCIFCHGPQGQGDGPVAKIYALPPADLSGKTRPDLLPPGLSGSMQPSTDGDLYWTLTVGPPSQMMPPFGSKLAPMDRFYIVRYVRKLQRDAGAAIPPAAKGAASTTTAPAANPSAEPSAAPSGGAASPAAEPSAAPSAAAASPGAAASAAPSGAAASPATAASAAPSGAASAAAAASAAPSGAAASAAPASAASGAPAAGASAAPSGAAAPK